MVPLHKIELVIFLWHNMKLVLQGLWSTSAHRLHEMSVHCSKGSTTHKEGYNTKRPSQGMKASHERETHDTCKRFHCKHIIIHVTSFLVKVPYNLISSHTCTCIYMSWRWYEMPIKAQVHLDPFVRGWLGGPTPLFLSHPLSTYIILTYFMLTLGLSSNMWTESFSWN